MQFTESSQRTLFAPLLLGSVVVLGISGADPVCAQENATQQTAAAGDGAGDIADDATKEKTLRPTLALGKFKIHDLRPTHNETAKVTFTMHLAFSSALTEQQVAQLDRWQHRLRDQVIIAIRTLEVKEFQEPDLSYLRRKILNRLNRLFKAKLVEEVLLTEYLFRTD